MTQQGLSRKQREHLRHRQEILQVALKLFSEKGFHNVSMREIAEGAEFAVGTLYNFFENKQNLYKALMVEKAEEFHAALTEALKAPGDAGQRLKAWLEAKIAMFLDNLDYVRLYLAERRAARFSMRAGLDEEIRALCDETLEDLTAVFKAGIREGRFKKQDPYLLAVALDGMSNAFLFDYVEHTGRHPFDADLILDLFSHGILIDHQPGKRP